MQRNCRAGVPQPMLAKTSPGRGFPSPPGPDVPVAASHRPVPASTARRQLLLGSRSLCAPASAPGAGRADALTPTWLRGSAGSSAAALPSPQREPSGGERPSCPIFALPQTAVLVTETAKEMEGSTPASRDAGDRDGPQSYVCVAGRGAGTGRGEPQGSCSLRHSPASLSRGPGPAGAPRDGSAHSGASARLGSAAAPAVPRNRAAAAAAARRGGGGGRSSTGGPAPSPAPQHPQPSPTRAAAGAVPRAEAAARPGPSVGCPPCRSAPSPALPAADALPGGASLRCCRCRCPRTGAPAAPRARPALAVRHPPGRPPPPRPPGRYGGAMQMCQARPPPALPGASGDGRRPERVPCGCGRGRAPAGCGRWRQAGCPPLRPEPALTTRILPRLRGGAARGRGGQGGPGTAPRGGSGGRRHMHTRVGGGGGRGAARPHQPAEPARIVPHRPAPGSPPHSAPAGADLAVYLRQVNPRQALPLRALLRDPCAGRCAGRSDGRTVGRRDGRTWPGRGQPRRRAGASRVRVPLTRGGRWQGHAAPRRSAPGALRRSSRGGGAGRGARRPRLGPPRRRLLRPSSAPPASARPRPRPRAAAPLAAAWSSRRLPRAAPRRGGLEQPGPPRPAARTAEPQPPGRRRADVRPSCPPPRRAPGCAPPGGTGTGHR
ncbi:basic proline-rich protein-like [Empidonax traillii]|uniref:basic proline-rich protein-like n=1 Tax=Empidonax traillii TaxID=164674 RepID=UPI000FFD0151|nr:basic proline-rich protein-like [Empidonax traillii]